MVDAVKQSWGIVDDYIAAHPQPAREILTAVRVAIRKAVPKAEESIAYGMPAYKLNGRPLIYFAGWKRHYSIYPASTRLVAEFRAELAPYQVEKGTIRFPWSAPAPVRLIGRLAKFRVKEVAAEL
jgi:uncharacterized protein YdhG (YjbR/CyaY superfamily)